MLEKYNGWASYETWLVNLWFGDSFADYFEDRDEPVDGDDIKAYVEEMIDEDTPDNGFVSDLIGAAMREVDWDELADHANEDIGFVDEDED